MYKGGHFEKIKWQQKDSNLYKISNLEKITIFVFRSKMNVKFYSSLRNTISFIAILFTLHQFGRNSTNFKPVKLVLKQKRIIY